MAESIHNFTGHPPHIKKLLKSCGNVVAVTATWHVCRYARCVFGAKHPKELSRYSTRQIDRLVCWALNQAKSTSLSTTPTVTVLDAGCMVGSSLVMIHWPWTCISHTHTQLLHLSRPSPTVPTPPPKTAEDETWLTRPLRAQLLALQRMCVDTLRQVPLHLSPRFVLLMEVRAEPGSSEVQLEPVQACSQAFVPLATQHTSAHPAYSSWHRSELCNSRTNYLGAKLTGCRHGRCDVCCTGASLACVSVGGRCLHLA